MTSVETILQTALKCGLAHNGGAGGQYLLCATKEQLESFAASLASSMAAQPAIEPQWIVNDLGELGVAIGGRFFFLYKGDNIEYGTDSTSNKDGVATHDDGAPMKYRMVGKREFGETCHPITQMKVENGILYDRTPYPYTLELVYTPGLSFGSPGDGDWQPLPAAPAVPSDPKIEGMK